MKDEVFLAPHETDSGVAAKGFVGARDDVALDV